MTSPFLRLLCFVLPILIINTSCSVTSKSGFKNLKSFPSDVQYATKYQNQLEKDSEVIKTWYHYTLEKMPNGTYIYKQFYPNTRQMTHFYTYSDNLKAKNGKAKEWYDNGNKRHEGTYINDRREGEWEEFDFQYGTLKRKGLYRAGLEEGKWIELDTSGRTRASFFYKNGQRDGVFKVFDEQGELVSSGWYEKDKLIKKEKQANKKKKPDVIERMPFMKSCEQEDEKLQQICNSKTLLTAIYSHIKYPILAKEKGIEGKAIVHFVVEKDGKIAEVEVIRGLCKEIKAACLETITHIPEWKPGIRDGEAVRVSFFIPIMFKLEY